MANSLAQNRFSKAFDKEGNLQIRVTEDVNGNLLQNAETYSAANPPSTSEFPNWLALVNTVNATVSLLENKTFTTNRIFLSGIGSFTFPPNTVAFNIKPQTVSGNPTFNDGNGNITPIFSNEGSIKFSLDEYDTFTNPSTLTSTVGDVFVVEYLTH